ncbi:hypothetical protein CC2G_012699 [Coprinopsis cinerea AmutBmut pab1-1]|nr:hypothetical protein CC2G_012699 [Coprinopsis cinerea AmutBmut pab1-1]
MSTTYYDVYPTYDPAYGTGHLAWQQLSNTAHSSFSFYVPSAMSGNPQAPSSSSQPLYQDDVPQPFVSSPSPVDFSSSESSSTGPSVSSLGSTGSECDVSLWFVRDDPVSMVRHRFGKMPVPRGIHHQPSERLRSWSYIQQKYGINPCTQAFTVAAHSSDAIVRQLFAANLIDATPRVDQYIGKLFAECGMVQFGDKDEHLTDFALAVDRSFQSSQDQDANSRRAYFRRQLYDHVLDYFTRYWQKGLPTSINEYVKSNTVGGPKKREEIHKALNLTKFLGKLCAVRLVPHHLVVVAKRVLLNDLTSIQHIMAFRNLVVHSDGRLWRNYDDSPLDKHQATEDLDAVFNAFNIHF